MTWYYSVHGIALLKFLKFHFCINKVPKSFWEKTAYLVVPLMTVRFPVSYGRLWKDFPPHQNPSSQNPVGKTFPVPSQYCPGGQSIQSVSAKAPENGFHLFSNIVKLQWEGLNFTSQILIHLQCSYKLEISSSKSPTKCC